MLTWRQNREGSLRAAYLGQCRVGYVARSVGWGRWTWSTSLVRPEGGCYMGATDDAESAVEEMERAVAEWVAAAGLQWTGERAAHDGSEEGEKADEKC